MNAIKYLSYGTTAFRGANKEETKLDSNKDKMSFLTESACKHMSHRIEMEMPENGKFAQFSISWNMPDGISKAMIAVQPDAVDFKDKRRLSVGVFRKGSDYVRSSFLLKGTKKEILDYVKNPENKEGIIKTAYQLLDSVDKHYSELY